jgi:hypothetical protein
VGTSSARKAPVGKFWRPAKISLARFASGKEASPPTVQEVVTRYLTVLTSDADYDKEGAKNFLPLLVGAAASLGNFYRGWEQEGWEAALAGLGLDAVAAGKADIMPALLDKLAGPGNTLAEAVVRAALLDHLEPVLPFREKSPPRQKSSDSSPIRSFLNVAHFLGQALYRKLLSDLGESLEFHAPAVHLGTQRQEEIRYHILASVPALEPPEPADDSFSANQVAAVLAKFLTLLGQSV